MKFGLCIVGCGSFAKIFGESVQPLLGEINLYFASRDLTKAQRYCKALNGTEAFGSYLEAARHQKVDGMYICTPHYLHLEHTKIASMYGKHVLLEKPIANSAQQAKLIISERDRTNINLMVAENYRFIPSIRLCKDLIDRGEIGEIRMIQIQQESTYLPEGWRSVREKNGGGIFIDAGIHKVHFLHYLLGSPDSIYATIPKQIDKDNKVEDSLILMAKWDTGAAGLINHFRTVSPLRSSHWITVSGSTGNIYLDIGKPLLKLEKETHHQDISLCGPINGVKPMVEEFIESIRESRSPEVTGEDGLRDLELVEKAYESVEKGTIVQMTKHSHLA